MKNFNNMWVVILTIVAARCCWHLFSIMRVMTHDEAITAAIQHQHLVGRKFKLKDGETETVKAVVAWQRDNGEWAPHVCFYDWDRNSEGKVFHLEISKFFEDYEAVKDTPEV